QVGSFIKPDPKAGGQQNKQQKRVVRGLRFAWGTFQFDGVVDSMQETLDYFAADGTPLRSTVTLEISGIDTVLEQKDSSSGAPGTKQLTPAAAGDSVPKMAGKDGNSSNWKSVAAANNVDDPLHVPTGTALDMGAGASGGIGAAVGAGISAGAGA